MEESGEPTIQLDRSGPEWTGRFEGLGEVRVDADGHLTVRCELDDPAAEAALRHGWGELLVLAHRGVQFLNGTTLAPDEDAPAVLVVGAHELVGWLVVELVDSGWLVVSDRLSPTDLSGEQVLVHPRPGPALTHRSGTIESTGDRAGIQPARSDSDVDVAGFPTSSREHRLGGIVQISRLRIGEQPEEVLLGHDRFSVASSLHVLGALRPRRPGEASEPHPDGSGLDPEGTEAETPHLLIQDHLRLAALPGLRVRFDRSDLEGVSSRVRRWYSGSVAR